MAGLSNQSPEFGSYACMRLVVTNPCPGSTDMLGFTPVKWVVLREKVPNVLSRCHTKRRMDGTRPTFGMTPTGFLKKKIFSSRCHTKRRMDGLPGTLETYSRNAAHVVPTFYYIN